MLKDNKSVIDSALESVSEAKEEEGLVTSTGASKDEILHKDGRVIFDGSETAEDPEEDAHPDAGWYVVHTYSGHEKKVKANIEKIVESKGMENVIIKVEVPIQTVVETKDGKKNERKRIIFPGYVIVKMYMNDKSWFLVRNTRGVTGFVGAGTKPTPLTREEIENMGLVKKRVITDYEVGDMVEVVSGYLENNYGVVEEIFPERQSVRVLISMFGRETPVELEFERVTRIKK